MSISEVKPKVQVDRALLARHGVGNVLEHKLAGQQSTITAVTVDGAHVTLDGWYVLSLKEAHRQFKKIGRVEVDVVLAVSRHAENLGDGVDEWRMAA